jgi:hypothetical protein
MIYQATDLRMSLPWMDKDWQGGVVGDPGCLMYKYPGSQGRSFIVQGPWCGARYTNDSKRHFVFEMNPAEIVV